MEFRTLVEIGEDIDQVLFLYNALEQITSEMRTTVILQRREGKFSSFAQSTCRAPNAIRTRSRKGSR